jgi:hypothetical protein
MRTRELILTYRGGAAELVAVAPAGVDLADHLGPPDDLAVRAHHPGPVAALVAGPDALVVVALGPAPDRHVDPADLAGIVDGLPVGTRIVLLCAWPVADLPYHRFLTPLVAGRCQVRAAVPVDRLPGVGCAVVADRVDAVAPPGAYLLDAGAEPEPDADADPLGPVLRAVNEYVLTDFVTRPLRRRLAELEADNARLRRALARPRSARRVAWRVSSRAAREG